LVPVRPLCLEVLVRPPTEGPLNFLASTSSFPHRVRPAGVVDEPFVKEAADRGLCTGEEEDGC